MISSDYEPDSLRVMIASLDCHLKEAGSSISIAKDGEFVNSRKVLEGKARFLREEGYARGGGVLPYMGYIGMCDPKGCGFSAVLVINRVSILAILVINRVWF